MYFHHTFGMHQACLVKIDCCYTTINVHVHYSGHVFMRLLIDCGCIMAESNDQDTERRAYFLAKATARKRRQRQLEEEHGVCEDTKRRRRDDCAQKLTTIPPCRKSHPSEGIISLPYMPPNFISEQ